MQFYEVSENLYTILEDWNGRSNDKLCILFLQYRTVKYAR